MSEFFWALRWALATTTGATGSTSVVGTKSAWELFGTTLSALGWPIAAILIAILIIANIQRIGRAFRKTAIIRGIKFAGFEVQLDRAELDDLKENTEVTFANLIKKTDNELQRFRKAARIDAALRRAAKAVMIERFGSKAPPVPANIRFTIHVDDVVFREFLYQLTDYFYPQAISQVLAAGAKRRFSRRYGIIGLAWRTDESQGTGAAFRGSENQTRDLVERWGMFPSETHVHRKPACAAVLLRDTQYGEKVGLLYFDADEPNVFGDDKDAKSFAAKCEGLSSVQALGNALVDYVKLAGNLQLDFDLAKESQ